MPNASIHVRLSKQAGETNLSLKGYLQECRQRAHDLGAIVVGEHVDDGTSGEGSRNRAGLMAWLDDANHGRATILITPSTDRITREGVAALAPVLDTIEGRDSQSGKQIRPGVRLVTLDGIDSEADPEGFRWRFVIAGEVGRGELRRITKRNQDTQRRLKEAGRFAGGTVPYGTRVVKRTGDDGAVGKYLERHPTEAQNIERVAHMLIAGDSMLAAVRWLKDHRVLTRRGGYHSARSLRFTLRAVGPLILDPATWLALERRLKNGAIRDAPPNKQGGRPPVWLLARGNGVCGRCGSSLTTRSPGRRREGGRTSGRRRYVCSVASHGLCVGVSIDAEKVDEFLSEEYLRRHENFPIVQIIQRFPGQEELRTANARLEQIRQDIQAANREDDDDALEELLPRRKQARADVAHWEGVVQGGRPISDLQVDPESMGDRWRRGDRADRWRYLHEVLAEPVTLKPQDDRTGVKRGEIDPSRLVIEWGYDDLYDQAMK